MIHLNADQLYTLVFDQVELDPIAAEHLLHCSHCRTEWESLVQMQQDLVIVQASQPTPAALARYNRLFNHVTRRASVPGALWQTLVAALRWDSRQQPALQGVRTAGGTAGYRLLYASEGAEIDLMIEPDHNRFRLQGEFLTDYQTGSSETTLIQLLDVNGVAVSALTGAVSYVYSYMPHSYSRVLGSSELEGVL
jgi:hypothetical protein